MAALVRADEHQKLVRRVLDGVKPSLWLNGHHHLRFTDRVDETQVESLGMDTDSLGDLCLLVDPLGNRILDIQPGSQTCREPLR
jgi:hypothetical protein